MEKIELLKNKVRPYDEKKDKNIFTVSYSKLDIADQCPMQYKLKYMDKNYAPQDAIALDLGTLCHKILELKARSIMEGEKIDYDFLKKVLEEGIDEQTDKGTEHINGVSYIKKHFGFETFYEADNASQMNYEQKLDKFVKEVIPSRFDDEPEWIPFGAELKFDFVYNYGTEEDPLEVHFHGFIDSVSVDNVDKPTKFKVRDYKTSKKVYDKTKTTTSLQQSVYGLAMYIMYGILPEEYEYDFILINEKQQANTKGYLGRALKKLDKILNNIHSMEQSGVYKACATPLCHWCSFSNTNPDTTEPYKSMCPYFSLWTPQNKTFAVNKEWSENETQESSKPTPQKRKLIF